MKITKITSICLASLFAAIILFSSSCQKKEENTYTYPQAAEDNYIAESAFNRVYNQISKAVHQVGSKSTNDTINGCPTLYISGAWPDKTVILDFGTSCAGDDGVYRRGRIISHTNGLYIDSSTTIVSTFDNYYETINGVDYQVKGIETIVNIGTNQSGHPCFSVDVDSSSITSVHGIIRWTSQRENEWIAGYDTWVNPFDDEYQVTGSANGFDISGAPFSVNITSPLLCKFCLSLYRWVITSGALDIVNPGYPNIMVDYGTGGCDYTVTITVNGVSYTIVLA